MKKYLFVINPVSGGQDKTGLIEEIELLCHTRKADYLLLHTTGTDDERRIREAIGEIQPEIIVLAGGDGTIHRFAPLVTEHQLTLGIIPSGSANGLAKELGITMDNALELIFLENTRKLDVISINQHVMIHMADLGLNATLVKRYEQEERRGFIGYAISAIKELSALDDSFRVTVSNDTLQESRETKFLVIANSRMYGTGYEINPAGKLGDGEVEICILREMSPELIRNDLFHRITNENKSELFEIFSVRSVEIRCSKPVNFQSDGEYLGEENALEVKVLPRQIRVLCPERE